MKQTNEYLTLSLSIIVLVMLGGCDSKSTTIKAVGSWKVITKSEPKDPYLNWEHYIYLFPNNTGKYFGFDCKWKEVEKDLITVVIPKMPKKDILPEFMTRDGEPYLVFTYNEEDDKLIEESKYLDRLIQYRRVKSPPRIPEAQSR